VSTSDFPVQAPLYFLPQDAGSDQVYGAPSVVSLLLLDPQRTISALSGPLLSRHHDTCPTPGALAVLPSALTRPIIGHQDLFRGQISLELRARTRMWLPLRHMPLPRSPPLAHLHQLLRLAGMVNRPRFLYRLQRQVLMAYLPRLWCRDLLRLGDLLLQHNFLHHVPG
jgi:hypothetical protein